MFAQKQKPKRKGSPLDRLSRFLLLGGIISALLLGIALALPDFENRVTEWQGMATNVPACTIDNLEIAYTSDFEDEFYYYRVRPNGEKPQRISELADARFTTFKWTPDGQYLVIYMPNTAPGEIHIMDADTSEITVIDFPQFFLRWFIMPDSSAIIVQIDDSEAENSSFNDAVYRIDLTLMPPTEAIRLNALPNLPYNPRMHVNFIGSLDHQPMQSRSRQSVPYQIDQIIYAPEDAFVVVGERTRQRAGSNLQQSITVYDADLNNIIWQIDDDEKDYDVHLKLEDLSPANEILYYRLFYEIGENQPRSDRPINVFIANIDDQTIQPILENRPLNSIRQLTWSPDASYMFIALYDLENRTTNIYLGAHDGSNPVQITSIPSDEFSSSQYSWTPDGQYLSFVGDDDWLYLMQLESREVCSVAKGWSEWSTRYDWRVISDAP